MYQQELYVRMKLRELAETERRALARTASDPGPLVRRRNGGLSRVLKWAVACLAGIIPARQDAAPCQDDPVMAISGAWRDCAGPTGPMRR